MICMVCSFNRFQQLEGLQTRTLQEVAVTAVVAGILEGGGEETANHTIRTGSLHYSLKATGTTPSSVPRRGTVEYVR